MDLSSLVKMKDVVGSLTSASWHLNAAAGDIGRVVIPAAAAVITKAPGVARATLHNARYGETPEIRRKSALAIGACAFAAVGVTAAVVGHFVHKYNKNKQYRQYKRQVSEAVKREKLIERTVTSAVALRKASELLADNAAKELDFAAKPGCFAIFTYDPDVENEDFSAYRDAYVGASASMLAGAQKQLKGEGNLYIHADMVYEQPVYVAFYPCEEYELYAYKEQLIDSLGAGESYNKISSLSELD